MPPIFMTTRRGMFGILRVAPPATPATRREGAALLVWKAIYWTPPNAEGRGGADDPRLHVEVEQLLAGVGGIGAEAAETGALEHD